MDAAWALYEAWLKIQTGEVDTALVYGFGKSSAGVLRRTLALQLDPYTMTPLWPDTVSLAALQARAGIDAGRGTSERWPRWSTARSPTPRRTTTRSARAARRSRSCWPDRCTPTRCASTTARRSPTARPPSCSRPATGPASVRERPAWITGIAHNVDPISMGNRDLTRSPSAAAAGCRGGPRRRRDRRAARAVQPPGAGAAHRAGPGRRRRDQPVGRRAGRQPDVHRRADPLRRGGLAGVGRQRRTRCSATPPAARPSSRTSCA